MLNNIYTLGGIDYDQSTRQGRVGFRQAAADQRKRNRMSIRDGNLSDDEIIELQDENKFLRGQSMQAGYDALQSATNRMGAGLISSGANFVNDMLESTLGSPAEYEGDKGHITQGLNEAYDAASDAAMKMGPIGMIVGGAMKGVKALGTGLDAITNGATGTDGMCVCAGTKVFTASGKVVSIEDLKQTDGIIGWRESTKEIVPQTINTLIEPRQKECVEIILKNGYTLKCSTDHPIYSYKNYKYSFIPAAQLKIKDIIVASNYPNNGLQYLELISIKYIGLQTVYNLQADCDHTYLANGIITHNTTADAILGSNWLKLTPIGLVNSLGGSTTDTITRDEEAFGTVGSSYGGTGSTVDDAVSKSGKKYGLFSTGKRKEADALIDEADRQQDIMSDIADEEKKRQAIVQSGSAINANRRQLQLQGGIQQANMRRGREGMKLMDRAKRIVAAKTGIKVEKSPEFNIDDIKNRFPITKQLDIVLEYDPQFNPGYNLDYIPAYLDSIPYHKKSTSGKSVIVYNDKADAEDIALDLLSHGLREKDSYWRDTILPSLHNNEIWYDVIADDSAYLNQYFKLLPKDSPYREMTIEQFSTLNPEDQEIVLKDFRNSEAYKNGIDGLIRALLVKDELRESKRYNYPSEVLDKLRNTKEWQKALKYINGETPQFKNGGVIESIIIPVEDIDFFQDGGSIVKESVITPIEDIELDQIEEFQAGGSINVIPEGALHARKHNMEMEGITKKGIPVISENPDGEIEQQAEIERSEIIYRKSVTEQIEKLYKIYYNESTSQEQKDEVALEAGKLLVKETLYNTIDNTGELLNNTD